MLLFADLDNNRAALAYQRFPEDKRNRTIWARTNEEVIDILTNYEIEELYLGDTTPLNSAGFECKMAVVRWFESQTTGELEKLRNCKITLHSWDDFITFNMRVRLEKLGMNVKIVPFGT